MINTENPIKDTLNAILERIGNPITGAFILVWLATNWRVPMVILFGSFPEQGRVQLIEEIFNEGLVSTILSALIFPTLFTALYLFLMPLLKEFYVNWLNRSEYRTKSNRQQMLEDLREVSEYRDTLRAICAALKKDLVESQKNFERISELARNGQDPERGEFYSEIENISKSQGTYLLRTQKHIEHFFTHYTGELPAAYQHFYYKWGSKLKILSGLWLPKDDVSTQ